MSTFEVPEPINMLADKKRTLHEGDFADVIKDFKMGYYPGLSGWVQCNHKHPYKRMARSGKRCGDEGRRD